MGNGNLNKHGHRKRFLRCVEVFELRKIRKQKSIKSITFKFFFIVLDILIVIIEAEDG